jgi:beta-N-acetylhexosaminidase
MKKLLLAACLMLLAVSPASSLSAPESATGNIDTMIGQMIMVGFPGEDPNDPGVVAVREQLANGTIGGVVLYPENIRSAEQHKTLTEVLRAARASPVPFIGVDQEGGLVQRLTRRNGHTYFPSARSVGRNPSFADPEAALRLYASMAKELADAGFNMNFGPVVDLSVNPDNPVIVVRQRSFGADPNLVISLAKSFIEGHREADVVTVAKHFPGHGSSRVDSHKSLPDISKTWHEVELDPYIALSKQGLLDAVMVGHLYHPRFSDGGKLPASLSAKAVRALRNKHWIGFQGVVISDDLEMHAVSTYPLEERVIKAINAGTDIVLFSNITSEDPALGEKLHKIVADAVADGRIPRSRIEQSYRRIMALKQRLADKTLAGKAGDDGASAQAGIQ